MRQFLNSLLCKRPVIYGELLRLRRNYNFEKILFLNLIQRGDVVFDIGANTGYYTLLFSYIVGRQGQVHAFEPVPPTFEVLRDEILKKNRFDNIHLNRVAIADSEGSLNLYMPNSDNGQASIAIHDFGSWKGLQKLDTFVCSAIKLDDYSKRAQINRLNFIKCDVEGAELLVLKGATEIIKKYKPLIFLEVCNEWTKDFHYSPADIVSFLFSHKYKNFYLITDRIKPLIINNGEAFLRGLSGSANLLCVSAERHLPRVAALIKSYS
jgi:FkbM family methyltransferase